MRERSWSDRITRWGLAAVAASLVLATILLVGFGLPGAAPDRDVTELYARGRMLLDGKTPGRSPVRALGILEQVVAIDPMHAGGFAAIAQAYLQRPSGLNGLDPAVALQRGRMRWSVPSRSTGPRPKPTRRGEMRLRLGDWAGAREALRRCPWSSDQPMSRIRAQFADLLALQGRFDEALVEARIAESLDPLSPRARHEVASCCVSATIRRGHRTSAASARDRPELRACTLYARSRLPRAEAV